MIEIFLAILAVLGIFILFCATFTNLLYWYEAIPAHGAQFLREKFGCRLLPWALVRVVRTALTQMFVGSLWPLAPLFHHPVSKVTRATAGGMDKQDEPQQATPVLLIHGLYHNPSAWCLFRPRLMRAGFTTCHTFKYWSFATDYWSILERLEKEVVAYSEACGQPVCLVGHSLGGLLVRGLLSRRACMGKVVAAVTLGAPHQGSKLAALGLGGLARSLVYGGQLVRDVEQLEKECMEGAADTCPASVPVLSLFSPIDNMVMPQQGLRLSQQAAARLPSWQEQEGAPLDHVAMLYHYRTARITANFLAEHTATAYNPSFQAEYILR